MSYCLSINEHNHCFIALQVTFPPTTSWLMASQVCSLMTMACKPASCAVRQLDSAAMQGLLMQQLGALTIEASPSSLGTFCFLQALPPAPSPF